MDQERTIENVLKPPSRIRIRPWIRVTLAAAGLFLLGILLYAWIKPESGPDLVWLSGRPIPPPRKQTTWSKVRFELIKIGYPVWRHLRTPPTILRVEASLLQCSPAGAREVTSVLGTAVSTNAEGLRAWIIPPSSMSAVRDRLQTAPDIALLSSPRVITGSGSTAQLTVGSQGSDTFMIHLAPKVAGKSIRLVVGGQWVQGTHLSTTNTLSCKALLPDGGALFVEGPARGEAGRTNYVLVFSATAVDARGNPLKL